MHDAGRMGIQGAETMAGKEDMIAEEETATAVEVVMTKVDLDEAAAATDRYSRLAVTTRTRGMTPQMIDLWSHTMGVS